MLQTQNYKKISLALVFVSMMSCSKTTDKDALKDTQLCLNSAPASEAMGCLDKISSDMSPQAYKLRCSAVFIAQGYGSPTSFIDALDKINDSSGSCTSGCSSTIGAISALTFKNVDNTSAPQRTQSNSAADQAFNYCSLSETGIYMQISSLFKIGTYAANAVYAISGTISDDSIQNAISSGAIPPSDMGSLTIATYNASCQNLDKASDSTKKYCEELGVAVDKGSNPTVVGNCMIYLLTNSATTCP